MLTLQDHRSLIEMLFHFCQPLKGHSYVFHKVGRIIDIKVGHNFSAIPSGLNNTFHTNFKDVKTFHPVANDENLNFIFFFGLHFFYYIRLLSVPRFLTFYF